MVLMKPKCTWLVITFVREHNIRCKLRGTRDIDKILKMVCLYHKNIKCIRISHMRNEENFFTKYFIIFYLTHTSFNFQRKDCDKYLYTLPRTSNIVYFLHFVYVDSTTYMRHKHVFKWHQTARSPPC